MSLFGTVLLVLAASGPSAPQEGPAQTSASGLQPLRYLVGSCWSGKQPRGGIDTHCFTEVFGGTFIRDVHQVTGAAGKYEGETLYRWDPAQSAVQFHYWNSRGGLSTGSMGREGEKLSFTEFYEGAQGRRTEYRNLWYRNNHDSYILQVERKTDAGWVDEFRIEFTRRTDLTPAPERCR